MRMSRKAHYCVVVRGVKGQGRIAEAGVNGQSRIAAVGVKVQGRVKVGRFVGVCGLPCGCPLVRAREGEEKIPREIF